MISPLRSKNNWQPFYEYCHVVLQKRRVQSQDLLEILRYVDPEAYFESGGLYGRLIGPGFVSGRISLYFKGFHRFIAQNVLEFDKAPLKVIQEFNRVLQFLFGEKGTALFIDEALARDPSPEKILQRIRVFESTHKETTKKDASVPEVKKTSQISKKQSVSENLAPYIDLTHPFLEQYQRAYQAGEFSESQLKLLSQQAIKIEKQQAQLDSDVIAIQQETEARYPDLSKKIIQIVKRDIPFVCLLEDLEKDTDAHFGKMSANLTQIQTEVNQRDSVIQQVDGLIDTFIDLLNQFSQYQDLSPKVAQVKTQIEAERILKRELSKIPLEQLSVLFEQKKRQLQEILEKFQGTYFQLSEEVRSIKQLRSEYDLMLLYRLSEFFSGKIPYPDEFDSVKVIQADFEEKIAQTVRAFNNGKCSLDEYRTFLHTLAYDHDLLLIRQENSFRSKRLFDFRQEVLKLACTTSRLKAVSSDFHDLNKEFESLYTTLSSPFKLFSSVKEREDVNRIIRDSWIEFERLQVLFAVRFQERLLSLVPIAEELSFYCHQILDDIEHVVSLKTGTRPKIVQQYMESKISFSELFDIVESVEKQYPFAAPFLLWRGIERSHDRRTLLQQLYDIEVQKKHLIDLAKRCQAFRVHEDDRVDQMLELFERYGAEQDLQTIVAKRQKILTVFAEEIFLDFRSLDQNALLIKDQKQFEILIQELESGYQYSDLMKRRIERASTHDGYAFYLAWTYRLEVWIDSLERVLFDKVKSTLPDWVEPFMPICNEIRSLIETVRFTPLKKERLRGLIETVRKSIQDAPQECLVTLDEFEHELDRAPVVQDKNIFFFPGALVEVQ